MRRLLTPVQYEPLLEGLNAIRPLQLADEGKIVIPYPILCHNPPTEGRPASGKLARCTSTGSLVTHKSNDLNHYEYIERAFSFAAQDQLITFAQKVSVVWCVRVVYVTITGVWWSDPTYTKLIQNIGASLRTQIWFKGTDLYVHSIFTFPFSILTMGFYGFY